MLDLLLVIAILENQSDRTQLASFSYQGGGLFGGATEIDGMQCLAETGEKIEVFPIIREKRDHKNERPSLRRTPLLEFSHGCVSGNFTGNMLLCAGDGMYALSTAGSGVRYRDYSRNADLSNFYGPITAYDIDNKKHRYEGGLLPAGSNKNKDYWEKKWSVLYNEASKAATVAQPGKPTVTYKCGEPIRRPSQVSK